MKIKKLNQLKKGDLFKDSAYSNSILEFCFLVPNAGGYGGAKGEGFSAYVLEKTGFAVSFHLIHRKDSDNITVFDKEDMKYLSEVEDRIRQTAHYAELYAKAESGSDKENLLGAYSSSSKYGEHAFERGDIVRDCYDRTGIVLGVDGHSINVIGRVDYRVQVEDCGKKGVGIFRAGEISKIGKLDDVNLIED